MEPLKVIGLAFGAANLLWNVGRAAWSFALGGHPQIRVSDAHVEDGGRAIVSLQFTNTAKEAITLLDVTAGSPIGASVGVAWGELSWIVEEGKQPFKWPDFKLIEQLDVELEPDGNAYFDVCVRRDPLIVFGGKARLVITMRYETMGDRQRTRSITIVRTLPGRQS
jgi:hypothetical protein